MRFLRPPSGRAWARVECQARHTARGTLHKRLGYPTLRRQPQRSLIDR